MSVGQHAKNPDVDKSNEVIELEKKKQTFFVRAMWTFPMIFGFILVVLAGHVWMRLLVAFLSVLSFQEVINLTGDPAHFDNLPWGRGLSWYFLVTLMFYLEGASVIRFFESIGVRERVVTQLSNNHCLLSYVLYLLGFVFFVLTLRPGCYKQQFTQFCTTHMALFLLVTQAHFVAENIPKGVFWFLVPASLVIINDISAYLCGITMGKTPLLKISPKKTVEGFLGAWVLTVLAGILLTYLSCTSYFMICPMTRIGINVLTQPPCQPNPVFLPKEYAVPYVVRTLLSWVHPIGDALTMRPIYFHVMILSTFASLVAPFGGFFASGIKRAYKVKDFGDTIPGHGGITDRFDCQFVLGFFVSIYYNAFIAQQAPINLVKLAATVKSLDTLQKGQLVQLVPEMIFASAVTSDAAIEKVAAGTPQSL